MEEGRKTRSHSRASSQASTRSETRSRRERTAPPAVVEESSPASPTGEGARSAAQTTKPGTSRRTGTSKKAGTSGTKKHKRSKSRKEPAKQTAEGTPKQLPDGATGQEDAERVNELDDVDGGDHLYLPPASEGYVRGLEEKLRLERLMNTELLKRLAVLLRQTSAEEGGLMPPQGERGPGEGAKKHPTGHKGVSGAASGAGKGRPTQGAPQPGPAPATPSGVGSGKSDPSQGKKVPGKDARSRAPQGEESPEESGSGPEDDRDRRQP